MKALFISNDLGRPGSGGERVSRSNLELMRLAFRGTVATVAFSRDSEVLSRFDYVIKPVVGRLSFLLKAIQGYLGFLDSSGKKTILDLVAKLKPDLIFIDTSQFGLLAKELKCRFPDTKVIVFFHNLEALYYHGRLKAEGLQYLPLFLSAILSEQKSVKYANKVAAINSRDSVLIARNYGRDPSGILGVSLADDFNLNNIEPSSAPYEYLFVGSSFYANLEGIRWFVAEVAPFIDAKLIIVGTGLESLADELESSNVVVVGRVDDLSAYYYRAAFVVLPIFSGSGMKVKTAEALMYGRTVFGTAEAFQGYEIQSGLHGELCTTATEFIEKIGRHLSSADLLGFNQDSRDLYLSRHSAQANLNVMRGLLA